MDSSSICSSVDFKMTCGFGVRMGIHIGAIQVKPKLASMMSDNQKQNRLVKHDCYIYEYLFTPDPLSTSGV